MYILRLHCTDKLGVVAAVATSLTDAQCNIEESAQFNDHLSGQFFMRVVFSPAQEGAKEKFEEIFTPIAKKFAMEWEIQEQSIAIKTIIMVSKHDHCLNDLLYRWRTNQLNIDIAAIISNHKDSRALAEDRGLPFFHLPIEKDNKKAQEAALEKIIEDTGAELIVLARYMQVLSEKFCKKYKGRVINIHHSFLPGFKGARPYQQAHERGVKIIGATAHFATADLDEGPIIAQDVVHIDHSYSPEKLQTLGRDTETRVLAHAINLYTTRKIFLQGGRTVLL